MINELLFFAHTFVIASGAVCAWFFGHEALIAFVSITYIMANILVTKQIILFGYHATATDAYIIGSALGINLLNEFYGSKYARKALYVSFMAALFFIILAVLHNAYIPSDSDKYHNYFIAIFRPGIRVMAASFVSYFISQTVEYKLYTTLKRLCNNKYLIMRNWATLSISQAIDTVIFSYLGLYGEHTHIPQLIIVSYTIKLVGIFCMSPLLWFIRSFAARYKQYESVPL